MPRGLAHAVTWLLLAAAALIPAPAAWGQCALPNATRCSTLRQSPWYGDLDGNNLVNAADLTTFDTCVDGLPLCPMETGFNVPGDFNFDGEITAIDREFLLELINLSPGGVPQIPKANIAEVRTGKPATQTDPTVLPSRYVEFFTTVPNSPTTNFQEPTDPVAITRFREGWFFLKVCRTTRAGGAGGDPQLGTITVVVPLEGMPVVSSSAPQLGDWGLSRFRSVLSDESFINGNPPLADAVPRALWDPPDVDFMLTLTAPQSLEVPRLMPSAPPATGQRFAVSETDTNVTHLLVYRDPNPANTRPVPQVGQYVIPQTNPDLPECRPLTYTDPDGAVGPVAVPWNVIVDALTLVRSRTPGVPEALFGCVFADTPDRQNSIGPIGTGGNVQAPLHAYRCRGNNRFVKGAEAITPRSDTPFQRNPNCTDEPVADCGELNPDGTVRNCFAPQAGPYCSNADCCLNVCEVSATCCTVEWDQACVDLALVICTTCGQTNTDCLVPHPTPSCEDQSCCDSVCVQLPDCCDTEWDNACAALARQICRVCGSPLTGPCDQASTAPSCSDVACCETVCNIDQGCCDLAWDAACVDLAASVCNGCGSVFAESCCLVHPTPFCSNPACCEAVCTVDPFCCEVAWDLSCTQNALILADDVCADEGCKCGQPFSCFDAHPEPGCEDAFCCQTVCQRDDFCCLVSWDEACVRVSLDVCAFNPACLDPVTTLPVPGSCLVPHLTPGCDSPGCCSQVCAVPGLEDCCEIAWDVDCALEASESCEQCGDPFAGSCFVAHPTPNCADSTCCNTVCAIDSFCCDVVWDGLCAQLAEVSCAAPSAICGPGNGNRSCWVPSYTRGCTDAACCESVCVIDPFCCESRWDAVCAAEAGFLCTRTFPWIVGTEGCLEQHESPGCSNAECSRAVCSVKPDCCQAEWDAECVLVVIAVCPNPESCPADGDCLVSHTNAGCRDAACCNGVCTVDASCCTTSWDSDCANIARDICEPPPSVDWPCPCAGSCFEPHGNPGCEDGSCCNIVCNINPACCVADWDLDCSTLARKYCCGEPGCGSGCNKPCLEQHGEPFCDDPYCCEAVCQTDPRCCEIDWDFLCVQIARQRCASACGLSPAGDCFVPHDLPGCNQGLCCASVCERDPFCCQTEWDSGCTQIADGESDCVKTQCGDFGAGNPCTEHSNPASENPACCNAVCAQDSFCCDVEWDISCVERAQGIATCGCATTCGDPCAGDCCTGHANPSCDDETCCDLVCDGDDYCCTVVWDALCAETARSLCNAPDAACPAPQCGDAGLDDCCRPSNSPACAQSACCQAVCAVDSFCCQFAWDEQCAAAARDVGVCACAGDGCGAPGSGSCFQPHSTPNCEDADCCNTICAIPELAACCTVSWDADCVDAAKFLCANLTAAPAQTVTPVQQEPGPQAEGRRPSPAGFIPARERVRMKAPPKPAPKPTVPTLSPKAAGAPAAGPAAAEPKQKPKAPPSKQ